MSSLMRKPYTIKDYFTNESITIDLFELYEICVAHSYTDEDTYKEIRLPSDVCYLQMKNDKIYYAKLTLEEALHFSAMMYKSKMKDAVKNIFYGKW